MESTSGCAQPDAGVCFAVCCHDWVLYDVAICLPLRIATFSLCCPYAWASCIGSSRRQAGVVRTRLVVWAQEMMWGLLTRLCDLGAAGVCDAEQLLKVQRECVHYRICYALKQQVLDFISFS